MIAHFATTIIIYHLIENLTSSQGESGQNTLGYALIIFASKLLITLLEVFDENNRWNLYASIFPSLQLLLHDKIFYSPLTSEKEFSLSHIMNLDSSDCRRIAGLGVGPPFNFINANLRIMIATVMLSYYMPGIVWVFLGTVLLFILFMFLFIRKVHPIDAVINQHKNGRMKIT